MQLRLKRASSPSLFERATTLRALASLLRGGLTVTAALEQWHTAVGESHVDAIRRTSRLVILGVPMNDALETAVPVLGEDIDAVRAAIDLHVEVGADPVPLLERAAAMIEQRGDGRATSRAAAAGAKLSGSLVGGLPLVSLPLLPMARAPLIDTAGLVLLFFGLVLTAGGMFWMWRLVPTRPRDEPLALFADHVVAALDAGAPLPLALDVACRQARGALAAALSRARRRARLGQRWPEALLGAAPEVEGVVGSLTRAQQLGVPPGPAVAAFAHRRRVAAARDFEREVRRAPVLMVLPLVLCVLPAFGLLAVVPFLRGIVLG